MSKKVSIDIQGHNYLLRGDIESILKNRRFLLSLQRMHFEYDNEAIKIPFEINNKIIVLQDLQDLLNKYDYGEDFQEAVLDEMSSYYIEQKNFKKFAEKANQIRNDQFAENPILVKDFKDFKNVIEKVMRRKLYLLQALSAFHMAFSQHSCNFSVPGAGKTSIVYGAYIFLKNLPHDDPRHIDNILVIGPLSSFAPWENEYRDCFGKAIESQRLSGDATISRATKEQHLYSDSPKELTLVSHAGLQNLEKEIVDFLKQNKTMVVVDEAHRIKNMESIRGQVAFEIAKESRSRIILTGTPLPNGYEDLYNLFRFIYPYKYQDILGIHYDQLRELTKNVVSGDDHRVQNFVNNIKPFFIRIKKKDLKLPDVTENIVSVPMAARQKKIYEFIEKKYVKSFKSNTSATVKDKLNRAKLIRLRQAATNPALLRRALDESLEDSAYGSDPNLRFAVIHNEIIDDSEIFRDIVDCSEDVPKKFETVNEIIKGIIQKGNEKVIVWTIFIQNADELYDYLDSQKIKMKLLIGRIPQEERELIIEKFNDPSNTDFQVVIANPFSVSESISLHKGCHNAIYMERDYNAANFLQSKDRIHRVGLSADIVTNYFYLVSKDSIDSVINERLDIKVKRMEEVIDEDIPLFKRIDDDDETDIISVLLKDYDRRT